MPDAVDINDLLDEDGKVRTLLPLLAVGGGIVLGPNENLDYDGDVAVYEFLVQAPDGELSIQPVIMEPDLFTIINDNLVDNRKESN